MLTQNPVLRYKLDQIKNHVYFKNKTFPDLNEINDYFECNYNPDNMVKIL
jgi:hypothetical protein